MPNTKRRLLSHSSLTELATIEHLILLDLLGAPGPSIRSYFIDTAWLFDAMVSAERRLHESFLLADSADTTNFRSFFLPRSGTELNYGYIADDHVPFLQKGVNVLHVIPYQFPAVWHTLQVSEPSRSITGQGRSFCSQDDASALDVPTMRRWNLILRVFMCEYLGLSPIPTTRAVHNHIHRSMSDLVSPVSSSLVISLTNTCSSSTNDSTLDRPDNSIDNVSFVRQLFHSFGGNEGLVVLDVCSRISH